MAVPTSEHASECEPPSQRSARIVAVHEMTAVLLRWADELKLHEAGAHLSMAMHALRKAHPELALPAEPADPPSIDQLALSAPSAAPR